MIDVDSVTYFFISPKPVDMRKGRDKLAAVIRELLGKDPRNGTQAYIFYSKDYKTVKIFHRDYCGIEIYQKWFENGRMLKPEFRTIARTHAVSRSQLRLLLAGAVQATLKIE